MEQANPEWEGAIDASAVAVDSRVETSEPYEDTFVVSMTSVEREQCAREMARLMAEVDRVEESKRAAAKHHQAEIDELMALLSACAESVRTDKVDKRLEVYDAKIFGLGVLRIVRVDTDEVVFERALEADERQEQMFPPSEPQTAAPKRGRKKKAKP